MSLFLHHYDNAKVIAITHVFFENCRAKNMIFSLNSSYGSALLINPFLNTLYSLFNRFHSLPNNKILTPSKLGAFVDDESKDSSNGRL